MNKKIIAALIGFVTLVPVLAFAQSDATSNSNASEIAILEQLVVTLTKELEQLIANRAAGTTSSQTPAVTAAPSTNYSSYTPVTFSQFQNNPAGYTGQNIVVEGMKNTFLPSTGSGNSNFIEVTNLFDTSQPRLMFEVDSQSNYTAVVNALQSKYYPLIRVYGTGMPDKNFSLTSAFQTTTVSLPVISVSRVDWCPNAYQSTLYNGSSLEDDDTCPSWTTIAPASLAGTTYPTIPSSPLPSTTTPPPVSSTASAPTCTLTATPSSIQSGQSSLLSWSSTNATKGSLSGAGSLSSVGSMNVSPTTSTNYTATFTGLGGSTQCSASVTVTQPQSTQPTATISVTNSPVTYNGSAQAAVITSSIPGNIVSVEYNGSANPPTMPGTYAVTADFAPATDPNDYGARLSAGNFVINAGSSAITPANQTISFGPLQNVTYGIVGFTIDAQASSGLGVNFTGQGNCTVSNAGTTIATGLGTGGVLITGVGTCTVTAHQAGNQYYNPAPDVSQTFTIASPTSSQ